MLIYLRILLHPITPNRAYQLNLHRPLREILIFPAHAQHVFNHLYVSLQTVAVLYGIVGNAEAIIKEHFVLNLQKHHRPSTEP